MIKECIICGSEFSGGPQSKYCSEKCKNSFRYTGKHDGETYNELKIKSTYFKNNKEYVECECSCGKIVNIRADSVLSGKTISCGHINESQNLIKPSELSGKTNKYGVKALYKIKKKGKTYVWHCICSCGTEFDTTSEVFNRIKSCGCAMETAWKANQEKACNEFKKFSIDNTNALTLKIVLTKTPRNNNTSGVLGVYWDKNRKKWRAAIGFKKKTYFLGRYDSLEDAAAVRKIAEEKLFGNFLKWYQEEFSEKWGAIKEKEKNIKSNMEEKKSHGVD